MYSSYEQEQEFKIHKTINLLICKILDGLSQDIDCQNIKILYDRVSYRIEKQEIYRKFTFVKDFCMANSKREPGLQNADWIAGEASFIFKQKNQGR